MVKATIVLISRPFANSYRDLVSAKGLTVAIIFFTKMAVPLHSLRNYYRKEKVGA